MSKPRRERETHQGWNAIEDAGPYGMITIKADLKSAALAKIAKSLTGQEMPEIGRINTGPKGALAWMAGDEVLLLCPHEKAGAYVGKLEKALIAEHSLVVDVSDARRVFCIKGPKIKEVLAKGTPTPLRAFGEGVFCRSRIGQIAAAFWMTAADEAYVICFRSVGDHMFDWLLNSNKKNATLS